MKKNKNNEQGNNESFLKFLSGKEQKFQLMLFFVIYIILYVILTYLYPYPASISDSGSYVRAALTESLDTYRPFGYSRFLIYVHALSPSIHFLVFIQYIFNAVSTLLLIFSIKYFFRANNNFIFYIYAFFAICSPLVLYLSNSVLSDSLFASLTMIWITSGLWMVYASRKTGKLIYYVINLTLLFCLIDVRYTGLIYMAVTLLFIFISFQSRSIYSRLILLIIPVIIAIGYYKHRKAEVYRLVRVDTFTGFSGWQKASNALNCVPYIKLNPSRIKDKKVREFTRFVMQYDTLLILKDKPSARFMWDNRLPLKTYCFSEAKRTNSSFLYQWNYLGENVYGKFGSYIMINYPVSYTMHYLLPNCRLVLYPTQDQVVKRFRTDGIPMDLLRDWFEFRKTEKLYSKSKAYEKTFFLIPLARLIIWILVLAGFLTYLIKRKQIIWQTCQQPSFWFLLIFLAIYFAFSAYAGPFELRYIAPVHVVQISLIYIIINVIFNIEKPVPDS